MENYSPSQLSEYLAATDAEPLLLDVREPWEFSICKLEGSKLLPMGQVMNSLDMLDPERETVVICHHGIRSRHVAVLLDRAGFRRVINLAGGVDAWARDVEPNMAVY